MFKSMALRPHHRPGKGSTSRLNHKEEQRWKCATSSWRDLLPTETIRSDWYSRVGRLVRRLGFQPGFFRRPDRAEPTRGCSCHMNTDHEIAPTAVVEGEVARFQCRGGTPQQINRMGSR